MTAVFKCPPLSLQGKHGSQWESLMQHLQSVSFTGSQLSLMVSSVMLLRMSLHTPTVFLSLRLSPFVVPICAPHAGCKLLESSRPGESDSKSSFHHSLMLTAPLLCLDKGPLKSTDCCVIFTSTHCYQPLHLFQTPMNATFSISPALADT